MIRLYRGLALQKYSNEANWAQDGHILLQPFSHFNFFTRGLLQLSSYLDNGNHVPATSWPGAPDGSAYDTNIELPAEEDSNNNMDVSLSVVPEMNSIALK